MKAKPDCRLKKARIRTGQMASPDSFGNTGTFLFERDGRTSLRVVASDGTNDDGSICVPWEHVSISCQTRTPKWDEMCWVKDIFWEPSECVIQFHPPKSVYVNAHPNCLHLWMPLEFDIPTPPEWTIA